jgi:serine-type D-Ala-D-Ala endopeptidase (penicillin-binding protein 7)
MKFRLVAIVCTSVVALLGSSMQAQAGTAETRAKAATSQPAAQDKSGHSVSTSGGSQGAKKQKASRSRAGKSKSANPSRQVERAPLRPSDGQLAGLHATRDPLALKSSVALVVDQDTNEVLFAKNSRSVLPIASITKLMTSLVTVEAGLPLDEELVVAPEDLSIDRMRSKLRPGMRITRAQALQLALMSSENHAAHMLGRTYPGGEATFVEAMNAKARLIGMTDSNFADPTGLLDQNRSTPADLVTLVKAAYEHQTIREFSVSREYELPVGARTLHYANTNRLTSSPDWQIGLQKTGYISAAGRCLVMQVVIEGRRIVMVLLDSVGKYSRLGDANRIRDWIEAGSAQSERY